MHEKENSKEQLKVYATEVSNQKFPWENSIHFSNILPQNKNAIPVILSLALLKYCLTCSKLTN
jgi:hypothetical protein